MTLHPGCAQTLYIRDDIGNSEAMVIKLGPDKGDHYAVAAKDPINLADSLGVWVGP